PGDPLVIAGGPCAACPEPLADFLDLVLPGDGEEIIVQFARFLRRARSEGMTREETILEAARQLDGAYAPAHYEMAYHEDGTVRHVRPTSEGLPERVRASKVPELELTDFPTDLIVPFVETVHDRITLEIMRGCTRGCRFCQAGMLRRPVRSRSAEKLRELAEAAYRSTGHKEISLASLSSSDHPQFADLLERINAFAEPREVSLSLSSLRVSDQLTVVPEVLSQVRKSGLTIAPEAASERLRHVINKDVSEQELLEGAREAFRQGWRHIKLYFMVGLPTETEEDIAGIVELSEKVSLQRKEVGSGPGRVNVSIAPFVPKPHTPFQWEPMADLERLRAARRLILDKARMRSVRYSFHDPEASLVEAALARGDRRLGPVIERVWRAGGRLQNWSEQFEFQRWLDAFEAEGLSLESYATRERGEAEVLPWDHIDFGLRKEFLIEERRKARRGELTPDCRTAACSECGACELLST
ncbi:MAG: TIGR03960 family B12-binding radical SAM protein, partial [Candidatus Brocadiia bacterium]